MNSGGRNFYSYISEAARAPVLASEILSKSEGGGKFFAVCSESDSECELLHAKVKFFLGLFHGEGFELKILPSVSSADARGLEGSDAGRFDAYCERLGTLNAISGFSPGGEKNLVVFLTLKSLFDPAEESMNFIEVSCGDKLKLENLKGKLLEFGYYNESLCESPGQFAARGGVLDVYPLAAESPVRIDFFGDEIESVRLFNPDTQLSDLKVGGIRIDALPCESPFRKSDFCALDRFASPAEWFFVEPDSASEKFPAESEKISRIFSRSSDSFSAMSELSASGGIFSEFAEVRIENSAMRAFAPPKLDELESVFGSSFETETESRERFARKIAEWESNGVQVFLGADSAGDEKRAREIFKSAGVKFSGKFLRPSNFGEGVLFPSFDSNFSPNWKILKKGAKGAAFVGASDFFGRRLKLELAPRRRMFSRRAQVDQLLDFSELSEGDYVVHLGQGVCRYLGVVKMDSEGVPQEMIKLEFEDSAMLYLPLHKSHLLSRYIGLDKRCPKLSKLDSKSWMKIRSAAETATLDYASELLEIQSKRDSSEGVSFPRDGEWQRAFESSFPYVETPDQLRAAEEIKSDMESKKPMDRLLCADVGFGKTEIAMRAVFKCVTGGMQAAVLCPTTILCQQHYRTFRERFSGWPISIETLSRFRSPSDAARVKKGVSNGSIDILIGTHAMLSDGVDFKNLGLLVIDEEHRFGVRHKEKIKKLRSNIDVLSMSATPIPRTLYFSVCGARSISLMETPPKDRFPVETHVREYSPEIVKEAVDREISRGGQVFYLHNRVKTIDSAASALAAMFPKLRIGVGHGQMESKALEKLMADFIDGKYDILVCTTIIESGLDIPNCNTIIIEGADKFGLAQLYQLRGRVGRFTRRAYAWLLLHRHAALVESARKRLGAIRQYNKPGAGFRIATRDLQLRGCGNLLGARQSGHVAGVGFDLYCALLKRSIAILKGEKAPPISRASVALDFVKVGGGNKIGADVSNAENLFQEYRIRELEGYSSGIARAEVPEEYIPQTQLRIGLYRSLASCPDEESLDSLREKTEDRFGRIPEELSNLFEVSRIRILTESLGYSQIETSGNFLKLGRTKLGSVDYFKMNGRFPRLTKTDPRGRLAEIKNFLKNVLPSIR